MIVQSMPRPKRPRRGSARNLFNAADVVGIKRVWIVGSGFSRPLGGPLLADLFSRRFQTRVAARFPTLGHAPETIELYEFFHFGLREKHFEHAEDFLVLLDDPDESAKA